MAKTAQTATEIFEATLYHNHRWLVIESCEVTRDLYGYHRNKINLNKSINNFRRAYTAARNAQRSPDQHRRSYPLSWDMKQEIEDRVYGVQSDMDFHGSAY